MTREQMEQLDCVQYLRGDTMIDEANKAVDDIATLFITALEEAKMGRVARDERETEAQKIYGNGYNHAVYLCNYRISALQEELRGKTL